MRACVLCVCAASELLHDHRLHIVACHRVCMSKRLNDGRRLLLLLLPLLRLVLLLQLLLPLLLLPLLLLIGVKSERLNSSHAVRVTDVDGRVGTGGGIRSGLPAGSARHVLPVDNGAARCGPMTTWRAGDHVGSSRRGKAGSGRLRLRLRLHGRRLQRLDEIAPRLDVAEVDERDGEGDEGSAAAHAHTDPQQRHSGRRIGIRIGAARAAQSATAAIAATAHSAGAPRSRSS